MSGMRQGMGREALLVLADGTTFEGEAHRRRPRRRRRHRRGRVQHGAHRLPGGHHRPVLRRPDHHLHLPAHRQLRRDAARRRDPAAVLPRRHRPRAGPPPQQLAQRRDLDAYLPRHGVPGIAGIDTRRLTRHIRDAGAMPGRSRSAPRRRQRRRAAEGGGDRRARHRRHRPGRPGHHRRALHRRRRRPRAAASSPTTSASSRRSCATSASIATVEVVPGVARRPPRCWPASPTACSSPTVPATPPPCRYAIEAIGGLLGEVPVFGICLGHQLLATALGGDDLQAAVRPPRRQPPGAPPRRPARSRSPARTTTSPSPRARCRAPRSPTSTSTTA